MNYEIIPSILVKDFDEYKKRMSQVEGLVQTVQLDVLDGKFADNITFGDPKLLKEYETDLNIEVQLMVKDPNIDAWIDSPVSRIIVHYESFDNPESVEDAMEDIESSGKSFGLAINPDTPFHEIQTLLSQIDYLLIMTVHPGFSGQVFLDDQLQRIQEIRALYPNLDIEVDGGVNESSILKAREAGANKFVVNSAIFSKDNTEEAIQSLASLIS